MAKRFTDTDKWRKPWFRALDIKARMVWGYLTDNCDHAGIWPAAFDLISNDVGFEVTAEDLEKWFGDKLIPFADKYFIPGFVEFQYGELSEDCKPHLSVIRTLTKYGIDPEKLTLSKGYAKGSQPLKDKEQEKAKRKVKEEYTPEFEKVWKAYPRKDDKIDAFRAYQRNVEPGESELALAAVENYKIKLKRDGTAAKFIKLGSTFFNEGRWRGLLSGEVSEDFSDKTQSDDFWKNLEGA
jgi:hypothetical protein